MSGLLADKLAREMSHAYGRPAPTVSDDVLRGLLDLGYEVSPGWGDALAVERGGLLGSKALDAAKQGDLRGLLGYGAQSATEYLTAVPGIGEVAMGAKGLGAMLPALMTAWHGSPHKFTRFDHSKMGTGEGAQAYGWGAYLAENPRIAEAYRDALAQSKGGNNYQDLAAQAFTTEGMELTDESLPVFQEFAHKLDTNGGKPQSYAKRAQWASRHLRQYDEAQVGRAMQAYLAGINKGHLYEVDLPDEAIAKMLDWDAPLSEQPEAVREAIKKTGMDESVFPHYTGQQFYEGEVRALTEFDGVPKRLARQLWSEKLRDLGIPGIRYLDGASRSAGEGTRNFVVFDDALPKIVSRNGGLLD